jgi:DNA-binding transcriptional LysR family regulator
MHEAGAPLSADDLANYDCVLYGKADGSTIAWRFVQGADATELRPMSGRIVLGSEAQVGAVKAGFGIAQLATWLIKEELARGELVEILPDLATDGLPPHLVWPRSRQLSPKVDALLGLLTSGLRID